MNDDLSRIKEAAKGRWRDILSDLGGVPHEHLDGHHHPCPRCGGTDRFRMMDLAEGALFCNQCLRERNGDGLAALAWLRGWSFQETLQHLAAHLGVPLDGNGVSNGNGRPSAPPPPDGIRKRAAPEDLHRVYSAFLQALPLESNHLLHLHQRGLSHEEIVRRGYRTLDRGRWRGVDAVILAGCGEILAYTPGFYWNEKRGNWSVRSRGGLLIPCQNVARQIVALKVRSDKLGEGAPRYYYLSRKRDSQDEPSAEAAVHVPLGFPEKVEECRVTEGELKADLTSVRTGTLTISIPGVGCWRRALPVLQELGARRILLALDADARHNRAVAEALRQLAVELQRADFTVALETWNEEDGKGIDDLLAAGKKPEVLEGEAAVARIEEIYSQATAKASDGAAAEGKLVVIFEIDDMLDARTAKTWKAIETFNEPPVLFRHGGGIARVEKDEEAAPIIRPCLRERLRYRLSEEISFIEIKLVKEGERYIRKEVPVDPEWKLLENLLATPEPPLPILTRIVEVPQFSADGTLHDQPGYSPATRCVYVPGGLAVPSVPPEPTDQDVVEARRLITEELLGDFPFVGPAELAHTVALLVLAFVRELIEGPTPLHLVEKPSPGTGATLMVEMVGVVIAGRPLASMTEGRDEDEWRKRIFSKLRRGPALAFIDNLKRRLDSAALSSAITAWPTWEDRVLGVSEIVAVPIRCGWVATGNNPALSNEISRRTIRIRLDAQQDRPWLRKGFRHPKLGVWVRENRGRLVWASLTLIRNWIHLGRPEPPSATLGMFEEWSRVVGGVLHCAGIRGFLENLQELYEKSDEEGAAWRGLLSAWWTKFKQADVKVKDLLPLALEVEGLDLGEGKSERSQQSRLGRLLAKQRDVIYQVGIGPQDVTLRVTKSDVEESSARWCLRRLEKP